MKCFTGGGPVPEVMDLCVCLMQLIIKASSDQYIVDSLYSVWEQNDIQKSSFDPLLNAMSDSTLDIF